MKTRSLLFLLALLIIAGCQPCDKTEAVDLAAVKESVIKIADEYKDAWNNQNLDALNSIISQKGLYCGTDPSEIFDKEELFDLWEKALADSIDYSYTIDKRKIMLAEDGKSAIIMEYLNIKGWSPFLMGRQTIEVVKTDEHWEIDYISWGFLIKNEDVERVNKALMEE